jgi:hypothetical protein
MSAPNLDQPANTEPAKLPRRDWILLPLLSVFLNRIANRTFPQPAADIYRTGARGATLRHYAKRRGAAKSGVPSGFRRKEV